MSVHSVIERSGRTDDVRAEVKCLDYLGGAFQKLNTAYRAVSEKGENNEKERITLGFKP
jgi:hypothetical protein